MKARAWNLVTAPTVEPVSVTELKEHLRVELADEDALIADYAVAARAWCEEFLARALVTQTWEAWYPGWPSDAFELPRPPLQSVTSIKYTPQGAAQQTLSASVYAVQTMCEPGLVRLAHDQAWPNDALDAGLPVVVRYVCGYGLANATPAGIKQAVRWLVGHMHENREAVTMANVPPQLLPMSARWALDPLRFRYE